MSKIQVKNVEKIKNPKIQKNYEKTNKRKLFKKNNKQSKNIEI